MTSGDLHIDLSKQMTKAALTGILESCQFGVYTASLSFLVAETDMRFKIGPAPRRILPGDAPRLGNEDHHRRFTTATERHTRWKWDRAERNRREPTTKHG